MDAKKKALLEKALPKQAVAAHPTKRNLSTIKPIFVTERLNEVFGLGGWYTENEVIHKEAFMQKTKNGERPMFRATVSVKMYVQGFDNPFSSFGGSDNDDLGDALKGAVSDAITKIAAVHFHVGVQVYKGEGNTDRVEEIREEDLIKYADIISEIHTIEDLKDFYNENKGKGAEFDKLVMARKAELNRVK